jgi:hypothetical protein
MKTNAYIDLQSFWDFKLYFSRKLIYFTCKQNGSSQKTEALSI